MRGVKTHPAQIISLNNKRLKIKNETVQKRIKNEPKIESVNLKCPKSLSPEAQKEWKRIVKLYEEFTEPIICDLDVNVLQIYCEAFERYNKALVNITKSSEVVMISNTAKMNPWLRVANDAANIMRQYGELLLLDPVSRARVGLAKTKTEEDPMHYLYGD